MLFGCRLTAGGDFGSGCSAGLNSVQLGVDLIAFDELIMGAFFGDEAAFEHDDLIGIADSAQAVSNDDDCAAFHQAFERFHYDLLRLGVERGGRFIENENVRIAHDGAGDADALSLATRERETALTDE